MQVTAGALASEIGGDLSFVNMQEKILDLWGIEIDEAEHQEILDMKNGDAGSLHYAIARVISKNHTAIGWTSHGHNAEDVPMWSYGPCTPKGLVDNTELGKAVARAFGLNMKRIQKRLFVNLEDVFSSLELDETDEKNPVAKLYGKGVTAELPISKNILTIKKKGKTKTYELEGVVAAPTLLSPDLGSITTPDSVRVYAPRQAVKIMKRHGIK
jgi:alkaline phosphatase